VKPDAHREAGPALLDASYQLLVGTRRSGPRTMTAGRAFVRGIIRAGSGSDTRLTDAELDVYADVRCEPARAVASSACCRTFLTRELPSAVGTGIVPVSCTFLRRC
jgi:hypothetical protein